MAGWGIHRWVGTYRVPPLCHTAAAAAAVVVVVGPTSAAAAEAAAAAVVVVVVVVYFEIVRISRSNAFYIDVIVCTGVSWAKTTLLEEHGLMWGKNSVYKTTVLYSTIFLELAICVPNISVLIDKIAVHVYTHNLIDLKHTFR